ncbi:MAG: helix-turn-helix domain-containing protein, partial [Thermoplasmata archaeon]
PKDRYLYVIDPVADMQKPHTLSHVTYERENRKPIDYMHFDTVIARINLPTLVKNIMEFIFECGEKTLPDIAHSFNVGEKVAQNSVQSLLSKGLVKKRKDVFYRISMEKIKEYYKEYTSNPPK